MPRHPPPKLKSRPQKKLATEAEAIAEARRTMANTMLTTLAEESRSFRDLALRARVQSRAADALWDTDTENARALFKRAWDSAEAADEENADSRKRNTVTISRARHHSAPATVEHASRSVAFGCPSRSRARRRVFGQTRRSQETGSRKGSHNRTPRARRESILTNRPQAMAQRLKLARQLLDDGDLERALQFADPALYPVNTLGMNVLDTLREKNAAAADERYLALLGRAIMDPVSTQTRSRCCRRISSRLHVHHGASRRKRLTRDAGTVRTLRVPTQRRRYIMLFSVRLRQCYLVH